MRNWRSGEIEEGWEWLLILVCLIEELCIDGVGSRKGFIYRRIAM